MNEPARDGAFDARLAALLAAGAATSAPARWRAAESLWQRSKAQPQPVRMRLEERLAAMLDELASRVPEANAAVPAVRPEPVRLKSQATVPSGCEPLVQLVRSMRQPVSARAGAPAVHELANVDRFRRAWNAGRALEVVTQAAAQQPSQAGPLNSALLVQRTLTAMQSLSEAYLRRFVAHVESLQWIESALAQPPSAGKPARSPRTRQAR
jgi:hypothetical protein